MLFSPLYYPFDYGFIAGTLSGDGDPLDVLVLGSQPTFTGCVLVARPLKHVRRSSSELIEREVAELAAIAR